MPEEAAPTPVKSPAPAFLQASSTAVGPLPFKWKSGRSGTLHCEWRQLSRSWRWHAGSGPNRRYHEARASPQVALQQWLDLHDHVLSAASAAALRLRCAELTTAAPALDASPQLTLLSTALDPPTPAVHHMSAATLAAFAHLTPDEWVRFPVQTQRYLPRSAISTASAVLCLLGTTVCQPSSTS